MTTRRHLPSEHVFTGLAILAAIVCVAAGIVVGRYEGAVTVTRTVHVKQSFGKPDQSIDGAQINPNLAGFTCQIYQAKQTIICHRP